ncbi:unnamed protein product [Polarella glacialis]|uniref:EF-hand domain-containing protein n=1 Tax=Polarella glacialis TaxID=89957 RepID=A0A813KN11_POLGL|nr:unnamed protein product [Polarella glacialis]
MAQGSCLNAQRAEISSEADAAAAKKTEAAAARKAENHSEVVAFFRGTGTDVECRTLEQILLWEDVLMEVCHDYIQWLFPSDEPSRFNSDAPLLDEELQAIFQEDPEMQRNFRRGLTRFIQFLGLVVEEANERAGIESFRIAKAAHFEKRVLMCWRGPSNHNWRRMTRVLRCLGLLNMREEQRALFAALEVVIAESPGLIEDEAILRWRSEVESHISAGFAAAVLESPNLLSSLCRHYFQKYDKNGNGVLEISEALTLAGELNLSLGLPSDVLDEEQLAASFLQFGSAQAEQVALCSDAFRSWFSEALRATVERSHLPQPVRGKKRTESEEFINPSFATALLNSPNMLAGQCSRYFKKYDTNQNGRLELAEAIVLARELHESFGMPAETLDEWQLLSTSDHFRGQEAGLSAQEFPAWFAEALEAAIEKSASRCPPRTV